MGTAVLKMIAFACMHLIGLCRIAGAALFKEQSILERVSNLFP